VNIEGVVVGGGGGGGAGVSHSSKHRTFFVTSWLVALAWDSTSIKSSSSRVLPVEFDSSCRMRDSVSCRGG
jgi:hypothetical protein